mmetsp:Transcript_75500/g.218021  ORF Transcript_75500/g.218021 Transcript_75500/m.218021 type:complete len:204 (+) Transcript_75500:51-662(+)
MALVARDSGSIPPEQLLNIDAAQLRNAKDAELLKSIRVRFIEDGPDRTLDAATKYGKTCTIEGLSAQQSIFELRQQIAEQEKMPLQDVNLFGMSTVFPDDLLLADCYADWMGYGLEDDKTMSDYDIERVCVAVKFEKSAFDEQGNYVFDDAYWDDAGYHPQPPDCWIPLDSLGERGRPDAHNVDATQPLSIVSDRRAKEAAEG